MNLFLLTKSSTFIIGPVATILGYMMNGIFFVLDKIGIPNIGLAIILFTFVIYMLLLPLTIRQQKFSKLQSKMMPEVQKIQDKYKNKKDNDSMVRQNEEIQAVYKKYGVSATGSCVQLLIQMPILFALYRVIFNIPAYVPKVKEAFFPLVDNLIATKGSAETLQSFQAASQFSKQFADESFTSGVTSFVQNTYIDVLNKISTTDWDTLRNTFSSLTADINATAGKLQEYNNFLGINIGDSPSYMVKTAYESGAFLMIIVAFIIPVLAAATQWFNVKLMPQQQPSGNQQQDSMMNSMKTMNVMMPLMSAFFCFTLPAGMGLYWIAGSVIRSVQQIFVNKHIDKMDIDSMIKKNMEKAKAKEAKNGGKKTTTQRAMSEYATMSTKNITSTKASLNTQTSGEKEEALQKAKEIYSQKKYKEGSLASKVNMVSEFNNGTNNKDTDQ